MFKPLRQHNFKYTVSQDRIEWCKGVYKTLGSIVKEIPKINFSSYNFNDVCDVDLITEDNTKYSAKQILAGVENNSVGKKRTQLKLQSIPQTMDYCITGGTAYEILNATYPNVNLRKYMDPTGDMDIVVQTPLLKIVDNDDDTIQPILSLINHDGVTINTYYRHLMHWMYDEFAQILQNIDLTQGFSEFTLEEYPERHIPKEHQTEMLGFRSGRIGNCILVCFLDRIDANMIKVQLTGKINNTIDHLVEFIFVIPSLDNNVIKCDMCSPRPKLSFNTVSNVHIQTYVELFSDNVLAYLTRYIYPENIANNLNLKDNYEFIHKSTNHVGRIIYIFELISYLNLSVVEKNKIKTGIESIFGPYNKDLFFDVFKVNTTEELFNTAYFYYYEYNTRSNHYDIKKIRMVDLLSQYNELFQRKQDFVPSSINFMGIPTLMNNNKNAKSIRKLVNKNTYLSNLKYFTHKHSKIQPSIPKTKTVKTQRSIPKTKTKTVKTTQKTRPDSV